MATIYDPTKKLGVGDEVKTFDDGKDGYPRKMVHGKVLEVGDDSFLIQWKDFKEPTEYEFSKVTIKGNQIFD